MNRARLLRIALPAVPIGCFFLSGGLLLLAAEPDVPANVRCTAALSATPAPKVTPPDQSESPSGPVAAQAPPASDGAAPPGPNARLYMPDGQLVSHGLTVYVDADLHSSTNLQLKLFRSHAITNAAPGEDQALLPALVASGQQWTEVFQGREIHPTGTLLIFNPNERSFGGKAMVRVRPLLTWTDAGGVRCAVGAADVNVGDITFAMAWTAAAVVLALLAIIGLAFLRNGRSAESDGPMYLLTGIDGHLSLSQLQIVCWTVFVGSIVLGYGLIRREIPEIPESLLVLMGASLATGGLAYFQDAKNATTAAADGATMAKRTWAWGDLVRVFPAGRDPEPSLAKAQMLFWTVLLLLLFVSKSILDGQIWAVPWPLVALMGFSQAGYLAPKVANPSTPAPVPGNRDEDAPKQPPQSLVLAPSPAAALPSPVGPLELGATAASSSAKSGS